MKKLLFLSLFCIIFCSAGKAQTASIQNIISEIQKKLVSDKRVCIFEVNFNEDNSQSVLKGEISDAGIHQTLISEIRQVQPEVKDSIRVLPDSSFGENYWGIVPLSAIFIRQKPNFGAELTTQALMGTPVKILQKKGGWLQVQTPDRYIGWTSTDNIERINQTQLNEYNRFPKAIVISHQTRVLKNPQKKSDQITEAIMGDMVVITESKSARSKYCSVTLPDGKTGYVKKEDIRLMQHREVNLSANSLIKLSKTFMGLPYLWGGTSSRGMDCSGFTKTVFFMHGIILPRDASQQYYCGTEVDTSAGWGNLRKGDLLFFGKKNASNPEKPSIIHVAIYIGDLKFIHSSGEIRINSFDPASSDYDSYNHARFIGAKRIDGTVLNGYWNLYTHPWYTSTITSK